MATRLMIDGKAVTVPREVVGKGREAVAEWYSSKTGQAKKLFTPPKKKEPKPAVAKKKEE